MADSVDRPSVAIAGAGALGSAFAVMLRGIGCDVALLGRNRAHMDAVESSGLSMSGLWGDRHVDGLTVASSADELPEVDYVLVTTKSMDTARIVADVAPHQPSAQFVTLQNGLGNMEAITDAVGADRTIGGMVIIGFTVPEPGTVKVTVYGGDVLLGRWSGSSSESSGGASVDDLCRLVDTFNDAGITAHATDNIRGAVWGKVLYNCALNPLGAVLGVPYGELASPHTWGIIQDVVHEAFSVARAEGVTPPWPDGNAYLEVLKRQQLPDTARHRASMLQDIERGRHTEIDHLNGAVARLAVEHGIAAPVNASLAALVRHMSARSEAAGG